MYLQEIGQSRILTMEEEQALGKRIVEGDESAKKELAAFVTPSTGGVSKERLPIILMYLTKTIFQDN